MAIINPVSAEEAQKLMDVIKEHDRSTLELAAERLCKSCLKANAKRGSNCSGALGIGDLCEMRQAILLPLTEEDKIVVFPIDDEAQYC